MKQVHLYYDLVKHDPILLIPDGSVIRIINVLHFKPRDSPPFPLDDDIAERQIPDSHMVQAQADGYPDSTTHRGDQDGERMYRFIPELAPPLLDSVPSWIIDTKAVNATCTGPPEIQNCEVAARGAVVVAVDRQSVFYTWTLRT